MKKKIVLIIMMIFLCCGCTTEYIIEIGEDLSIKETAIATNNSEFFDQYPKSSVETVIGFLVEPHLKYLNDNGFTISNVKNEEEAGIILSNSYDSIEEYIETSKIYEQYGDLQYIENDGEITLTIKGMLSNNEQDQSGKYLIDTSVIKIKLPHNVKSHNADEVDEENGIYTWNINEAGVEKEIFITFDKKIKKDIPIQFIVVGIMIVFVLIIAYMIWSKAIISKKQVNEI